MVRMTQKNKKSQPTNAPAAPEPITLTRGHRPLVSNGCQDTLVPLTEDNSLHCSTGMWSDWDPMSLHSEYNLGEVKGSKGSYTCLQKTHIS